MLSKSKKIYLTFITKHQTVGGVTCPPQPKKGNAMSKLLTLLIFTLVIFTACQTDRSSAPVSTDAADVVMIPVPHPLKVVDPNGTIWPADSTRDQMIEGAWYKTVYLNGEINVQFPFESNTKGFSTLK